MTLQGVAACLNGAPGQCACSTAGSAIALRDWQCRRTPHRRKPAQAVKCGRRTIRSERKCLTAVNRARVEEFEMARLKLRHQERCAIE